MTATTNTANLYTPSLAEYQSVRIIQDTNTSKTIIAVSGDWVTVGTGKNGQDSKTFRPDNNTLFTGNLNDWTGSYVTITNDGIELHMGGTLHETATLMSFLSRGMKSAKHGGLVGYINWHINQRSGNIKLHWADFTNLDRISNGYTLNAKPAKESEVWRANCAELLDNVGLSADSGASTEEAAVASLQERIDGVTGALRREKRKATAARKKEINALMDALDEAYDDMEVAKVTSGLTEADKFTNELIEADKFTQPAAALFTIKAKAK